MVGGWCERTNVRPPDPKSEVQARTSDIMEYVYESHTVAHTAEPAYTIQPSPALATGHTREASVASELTPRDAPLSLYADPDRTR